MTSGINNDLTNKDKEITKSYKYEKLLTYDSVITWRSNSLN